ncbi:MAG: DUF2924 domain-containing protein [Planctomycetes bacterium]|nr:DUF2924 domain-containing protein [Planctomycetota bacterium]
MTTEYEPARPRGTPATPDTDVSLAVEIAALNDLDYVALCVRYADLFGRPARYKLPGQLRKRIAWELQVRAHGGLSDVAKAKLAELQQSFDLPVEVRVTLPTKVLPTGTLISREWRNQKIDVVVTDSGFEWNGIPYASLSAVAKAVTGTAWNGPVFFGLRERKRK